MVVVTTGVGVAFRPIYYFRNLSEMEQSCVELMERSQEFLNEIIHLCVHMRILNTDTHTYIYINIIIIIMVIFKCYFSGELIALS